MDIEEFVKDILNQITRSVNDNTSGGKTKYYVDSRDGVSFDLAVTVSSSTTQDKTFSGGVKVRIVGAEGGKSERTQDTHEQSSRVKFKVVMYGESDDDGVEAAGNYPGFNY